ncbi:MAG: F0F1 ATP synthase subunit B [Elusimicrobiota bacterium]|jgi:F-type H+-transporting ATPase subunit b|nr:F0F1 ATP synthase subunit B [Elusimicrobiota bacterium]
MDKLLQPDFGLVFWTIVNFLLLVFVLAKFAWRPVISALDAREKQVKDDISAAKAANEEAQKIKTGLQAQLDALARQSAAKLQEAAALGEVEKQKIIALAKEEAQKLIQNARAQIETQTQKAVQDIKKEIAGITMLAVQKVIQRQADAQTGKRLVDDLLKDIKTK